MRLKRPELGAALAATALTALVFHCAPPARFLSWDDTTTLLSDPTWRSLTPSSLWWMLKSRHYGPWQPLSWLSWWLDYALWGLDPNAFRRTNIVLHAFSSGLFVLVCRRILKTICVHAKESSLLFGSFFAALFFSIHPLRVESVLWITERRDVLSGIFVLLSVLAWQENRRRISLILFVSAVLSKGTAVAALPFLFFLGAPLRPMLPHITVGVVAIAMNLFTLSSGSVHSYDASFFQRIVLFCRASFFYPLKTFIPFDLSPYYAIPQDFSVLYPSAVAGLFLSAVAVRSPLAPAWWAFLLAVAPVSGLLQNGGQSAADRYSYLSCLPFAVLAGIAVIRFRFAVVAAAILVPGLWYMTARQASYWRDDISLWTRAVVVQPDAYLPRSNLAQALFSGGRPIEAAVHYEAAIALEPRDTEARLNLAVIREGERRFEEAERLYLEAIALKPRMASARFNLAGLLLGRGRKAEGLARLREALALDPSLAARLPRGPKN